MDTMIYLVLMILALALMIYGFSSHIGLLNILTIPLWIFFAVELKSHALIVAVLIGLALTNLIIPIFRNGGKYE